MQFDKENKIAGRVILFAYQSESIAMNTLHMFYEEFRFRNQDTDSFTNIRHDLEGIGEFGRAKYLNMKEIKDDWESVSIIFLR